MEIVKKIQIKNIFFFITLFIPIIYIAGSLLLNVSILLIIFLSFFYLKIDGTKIFFKKHKYFIFFILSVFVINIISSETKLYSLAKLSAYLRFLLLPISYIFLISQLSDRDLKKISKFHFVVIIFVILDSLIQLIFGKDIFGFEYFEPYKRITGPFGDEMIVGFYLLNFGILAIAFLNYFNLIKKKTNFILLLILSIFILLSGERSAFLSFFIFLFFTFFISKNKKLIFFTSVGILIASIILVSNITFLSKKYPIEKMIESRIFLNSENLTLSLDTNENLSSTSIEEKNINYRVPLYKWYGHFERSIEIIKKNTFFGSGFRNYRIICFEYQKKYFNSENISKCSTHPHNFHLEILSDSGVIGYFLFITFSFYIVLKFFNSKFRDNLGITMIFCLILSFIFPLKTTGSIFTTNYAFVFWYLVSNYLFLIKKK